MQYILKNGFLNSKVTLELKVLFANPGNLFVELVESVAAELEGAALDDTFVWLDIFAINQVRWNKPPSPLTSPPCLHPLSPPLVSTPCLHPLSPPLHPLYTNAVFKPLTLPFDPVPHPLSFK